ncbi:MAG: hypothetical protein WBA43_19130 [Elainellaceae cyanobacterium]
MWPIFTRIGAIPGSRYPRIEAHPLSLSSSGGILVAAGLLGIRILVKFSKS